MKHVYKPLGHFFLITFVLINTRVCGQEGSIRGQAIDAETGKPVEYTYVLNYSLHKSIYSNTGGEFNLGARPGDTLVLYAVGYYYQKTIVTESMLGTPHDVAFRLKQQVYELSEARIIGLGTYDDFKQQFLDLKRPRTQTDILSDNLAEIACIEGKDAYDKALARGEIKPPSPGFTIRSPEEIERMKLAQIMEKEKIRDQIYRKYNPKVVKSVTGLVDDDEIIEFMVYCSFDDAYLLEVSEYDLMTRIALKYELFKRKKLDKKSMENPVNRIDEMLYPNA
jgi:hypothetical protein